LNDYYLKNNVLPRIIKHKQARLIKAGQLQHAEKVPEILGARLLNKSATYNGDLYNDGLDPKTPRGKNIVKEQRCLTIRKNLWVAYSFPLLILTIVGTFMKDTNYLQSGCAFKLF